MTGSHGSRQGGDETCNTEQDGAQSGAHPTSAENRLFGSTERLDAAEPMRARLTVPDAQDSQVIPQLASLTRVDQPQTAQAASTTHLFEPLQARIGASDYAREMNLPHVSSDGAASVLGPQRPVGLDRVMKAIDGIPPQLQEAGELVQPRRRLTEELVARHREIEALAADTQAIAADPALDGTPIYTPVYAPSVVPTSYISQHEMSDGWTAPKDPKQPDIDLSQLHGWLQENRAARRGATRYGLIAAGITLGMLIGGGIAFFTSQGPVTDLLASKPLANQAQSLDRKSEDKFLAERAPEPIQPTALMQPR